MASSPAAARIILGSQSQDRHAILRDMGYTDFEVVTANIDESAIRAPAAEDLVVKLAHAKAEAILSKLEGTELLRKADVPVLLITADQVVVHEGVILEKPKSAEEARRVIPGYSRAPAVTVGAVLVTNLDTGVRAGGVDKAEVHFNEISDEVVDALIEEGEVFYSAGGLLVEHPLMSPFVKSMVGGLDSVMGMSKELTQSLIEQALRKDT